MLRVPVCALLAASCSASAPAPSPSTTTRTVTQPVAGAPEPLPFKHECVAANDASLADLQRRATAVTTAAFDAELARNHLHMIALAAHRERLAEGLSSDVAGAAEGTAVERKLRDAEGTFVAAETTWTGSGGEPARWEFVQDERGDIFRLVRQPRAAITRVTLCGCPPRDCGNPGSGCPACGSTDQTMYGPLPDGAPYRGELVVAYPANVVSVEYDATRSCPPMRPCEQPP